ncbi:MAG: hydrogenase/urease maturation nickel metallochaperone HypA [Actinomycetia bacterium]|nr:hydrogenase/urease maturation nickel metallochaperone HypA [Actinomycetes bacterium]
MHEYSITTSIIDIIIDVSKKNNLKKIKKVNFELSPFANIEPESIKFYYDFLTGDNNVLKDAQLLFNVIKPEIECKNCRNLFKKDGFITVCPACGSSKLKASDADDIKIISVET